MEERLGSTWRIGLGLMFAMRKDEKNAHSLVVAVTFDAAGLSC